MIAVFALCLAAVQHPTQAVLVWGGDAEGGAPFVEADPRDPSRVRGFDVEVAERIAHGLGGDRRAQFLQVQWSNIDQSVERGDFTLGLSGVEDTPARRARHAVTLSYFEFREVLAVRPADAANIHDLEGFFPNTYVDISPVLDQKKRAQFAQVFGVGIDPIRPEKNLQISEEMADDEGNQNDAGDGDDHFFAD